MTQQNDGPVFAPGDNLILDGVPPIPTALVERASRYTEFRSAALLSWHPERREMLIGTRFGDTTQVHNVRIPGGARTQLTFLPDTVAAASYSPAGGDTFVFTRDRGGNERYQNYRFDVETGEIALLTDGQSRNHHPSWSNAGDLMAYGSTRRNGTDVDLYMVRPADPSSDRRLAQLEGGGWSVSDWSPDDRALLVREYVSINESYLWLLDVETGEKRLVTPKGEMEKVAYVGAQFSKDGRGIYVATDRDSEFRRLAFLEAGMGRHTYLTEAIPWDVEEFDLSPDGKRIAFVTNEDGIGVLRLLDTETGREIAAPRLPAGVVGGVQWHRNGRDLGFTHASTHSPADVYSLDVESGQVERWTQSEAGGINTARFTEPEPVRWQSFDGRSISGFLYRPPERFTGKRPVAIHIHGGPESQFRPGFLLRHNYLVNELGVAMLFPNIRGSSGYGKTFLQLDNGFRREDAYKDIGALLDWIGTRADLDAERIMVTGGSYGGHMTLAVATRYNDRIRCALDIVGPSNLVTLLENTASYRRDLRRAEYGDERDPEMRAFLERTAPLNHAGNIRKPLFVVQGQNDPRVPASESEQMVATVKRNGTPVWYLAAKDEGHGFIKKKNADFLFYATVLFVREFLLG